MEKNRQKKQLSYKSNIDPSFALQSNLGKQLENQINFYRNKTLKKNYEDSKEFKQINGNISFSSSSSDPQDPNTIENNLRFYENFIKEIKEERMEKEKTKRFIFPKRDADMTPKNNKHSSLRKKALQYNLTPINEEGNKKEKNNFQGSMFNKGNGNIDENKLNKKNNNNASMSLVMPRLSVLEVKNEESFSINESKVSNVAKIKNKINTLDNKDNNSNHSNTISSNNKDNDSKSKELNDRVLTLNENKENNEQRGAINSPFNKINIKKGRHRSVMFTPNDLKFIPFPNKRKKARLNSVLITNQNNFTSKLSSNGVTNNENNLNDKKNNEVIYQTNSSKKAIKETNHLNNNLPIPNINNTRQNTLGVISNSSHQTNIINNKKKRMLFCCIPLN